MDMAEDRRVAVVIEDDEDIRNLLETVLTQGGFQVVPCSNGLEGVEAVRTHNPTVTTLDVNMPGIDGFETAKRIRGFSSTYIVMLTAREEEIDTLQGLDAGADDYITKPFRPRELRARIEAMLRRPRAIGDGTEAAPVAGSPALAAAPQAPAEPPQPGATSIGDPKDGWHEHNDLYLNLPMRLVRIDEQEVQLTRSEFDLLSALMHSGRRVRTKADLALLIRGENYATAAFVSEADKRGVEVHMGNLRRKIGESSTTPRWIETVRGVGYRLTAPEERPE
jgi:two-component system, OmpR family, response regulator